MWDTSVPIPLLLHLLHLLLLSLGSLEVPRVKSFLCGQV